MRKSQLSGEFEKDSYIKTFDGQNSNISSLPSHFNNGQSRAQDNTISRVSDYYYVNNYDAHDKEVNLNCKSAYNNGQKPNLMITPLRAKNKDTSHRT